MLYTRKGDDGTTGFFGSNKRISKSSARPSALGACDELNSYLGVCKVEAEKSEILISGYTTKDLVEDFQKNLFIIQGELAGAHTKIKHEKIKHLEEAIAEIEKELPPIKMFKIAGGTKLSAMFDYARAISRRTERTVIRAKESGEVKMSDTSMQYLNRLSTVLYALSRLVNVKSGINEGSPTYE